MNLKENTRTLPASPVEVLRLAAADLRKCGEDERFIYDPQEWHAPSKNGRTGQEICYVCVAGAVMAQTLGARGVVDIWATDYADPHIVARLEMLDAVRQGSFATAVKMSDGTETDVQVARVRLQMRDIQSESFEELADEIERRAGVLEAFLKSRGLAP